MFERERLLHLGGNGLGHAETSERLEHRRGQVELDGEPHPRLGRLECDGAGNRFLLDADLEPAALPLRRLRRHAAQGPDRRDEPRRRLAVEWIRLLPDIDDLEALPLFHDLPCRLPDAVDLLPHLAPLLVDLDEHLGHPHRDGSLHELPKHVEAGLGLRLFEERLGRGGTVGRHGEDRDVGE